MAGRLVMAIDLGTGSCRALIFDDAGDQVAMAQREWSHAALPGVPGSQVFDTAGNWELICQCTREAIASSGVSPAEIAAVSSTSMREGIVLYAEDGTELWACPNVDSRATEEAAALVRSGVARRIYDIAGDWVSITSPARLHWISAHEPALLARVAHAGMLSDWVLTRLTGRYVTDPSVGASSGMFDLSRCTWSDEIVELCGLSPEVFPEVLDPGTVVGEVTGSAAAATGLAGGTKVVIGGADTQLGLLGIGRTEPGDVTLVGGSFWQTTVIADRPLIDPEARLRTLCHVQRGQWMAEGIAFYGGLTMRWFRDAFCDAEKAEAAGRGVDPFVIMEEAAATVPPGSSGIVPVFSNVMDAKRWVQSAPAFIGFDIENPGRSGRKECIRAVEESAAYASAGHLAIIESLIGREVDEIVFTGGGAKGQLWPRIVADVLGVRVKVPVVKESTALGAALCAMVGAGLHDDLAASARRLARFERTVEPDRDAHALYTRLADRWRQVYLRMLELTETGLVRPLWWPAGA